ncbi:MAG TPA: hypothetical protein VJG32_02615 [Anaerolineae bacterium]|nr:hypothetical protein [Anaerolineae bacterium]
MMLLQGVSTQFTFTIGWVDLLIMIILIIAFFRGRALFVPILLVAVALYLIRLFPNEILWVVDQINQLNGPAAFITISR